MKKQSLFWQRIWFYLAVCLLSGVLIFSLTQVVRCLKQKQDSRRVNSRMEQLAVTEVPQTSEQPQSAPEETSDTPERLALPQAPITVDFAQL